MLAPPGTADETQQEVITYNGNEEITLPGGRLTACKVTSVVSSVAGGVTTELSQEQMYLAKDLGLVKSYYKPTAMIFIPCKDGISHRPDEYSSPEAIAHGVEVLALTLAERAGTD